MKIVIGCELQSTGPLDLDVNDGFEIPVVREDHVEDRADRLRRKRQDDKVLSWVRRVSPKSRGFLLRGIQVRRKRTMTQVALKRDVRVARQVSHHGDEEPGFVPCDWLSSDQLAVSTW